jgi:hypothetical protein
MLSNAAFDYFSSLYKPTFCLDMIRFCATGRSPEAFAAEVNVTPEVFTFWARNHVEFEIALHISFWKSYAWWELQSMGETPIDSRIYNAVMKNRFKWKDGNEDLQKIVRRMNDKDLEQLARRLLSENAETIETPEEPIDDELEE